MSSSVREREHDDEGLQRDSKRQKVNEQATETVTITEESLLDEESLAHEHVLPPSHALLGIPLPVAEQGRPLNFLESDVGISEYVGRGVSRIDGIIKQRFTDFLVYEVDLDSNVIHLKSLAKPDSSKKNITEADVEANTPAAQQDQDESMQDVQSEEKPKEEAQSAENPTTEATPTAGTSEETQQSTAPPIDSKEPWPESFTIKLIPFLSESAIAQLKEMFLQGPEPPRISDSGWGSRAGKSSTTDEPVSPPPPEEPIDKGKGERGGRGRGGRGGRGGGRGGSGREDHRKVLSEPIESKETRTAFHKVIRDLFKGKLETETDTSSSNTDEGSRIVIKWSRRGVGRGGHGNGAQGDRPDRGTYPPYIHFTLQKTNRDTQDALSHLSRILHVNVKDLSVAGTKDKRGVTVQRVSLKRGNKIVEDIWRLGNSISRQKSEKDALIQRGERGVRIADLVYRKASLELGMLKGNAFVITLRNVQVDSMETLEKALTIVKNNGFINYYGMQRFGTASVPTHAIGLALLKSEWHKAVSLILQTRYGEHPEVEAARNAWLKEKDLDKALRLMPRRVVAERCILESYRKQKGDTRNAMGALSTIPRNLRLMYIHAYQSYVWNAIVSERIRMYGAEKPVAGDLVFEAEPETSVETGYQNQNEDEETNEPNEQISNRQRKKQSRKPWSPPRVKTLTDEDLGNYSIFDVIMPLPGTDVAYPGGELGERYKEFLEMDGLDPNNFVRKQKDYTLGGSYRKILHQPKEMSWSVLRYTDPDVPLAQADEDKLLGFDPPAVVENGKFMALQINLQLGTASYATMALREITKAETSSHYQTNLTAAAEDQKYRGVATAGVDEENEEREIDEPVTEGAEAMEES
ncbi:pseudouridine synthase [Moniliophthora roreri MCA 2997]|uniref:Pseudouridine synthase n=2 Tax=Moniliophthora roreri TaxID=221103 RepID=V2XTF4_MONRO|nr:pseudouridine synthase [Moniliophthora roreri MCA 2997]